ncbi:hypothetical protein E2C01_095502 [Portunus trituberculatus]|uniref:Uncharacterized protein n=1 Tax=Portunus trituberculatus TaxID=210409 RepID=A0A5B7K0B3_PORTR|nr:hypothetical protein [Portunus trituberculatus]
MPLPLPPSRCSLTASPHPLSLLRYCFLTSSSSSIPNPPSTPVPLNTFCYSWISNTFAILFPRDSRIPSPSCLYLPLTPYTSTPLPLRCPLTLRPATTQSSTPL